MNAHSGNELCRPSKMFFPLAVLHGAGVLLLAACCCGGCSERYSTERLVWQAERAAETVFRHAGAVSSYEFDRAVALFEKVITVTGTESDYAFNAGLRIAQLHGERKEFDKEQELYDVAIASRLSRPDLRAKAAFLKGKSYETQGNWQAATAVFKKILEEYPDTQEAVSIPLYIARYYARRGDKKAADQAYQASVQYFEQMAAKQPGTQASALAENMVIRVYLEMEAWQSAVTYIENLDSKYRLGPDTLFLLGKIYESRLNDTPKARATYERIIATWPDNRVAKMARQRWEELK